MDIVGIAQEIGLVSQRLRHLGFGLIPEKYLDKGRNDLDKVMREGLTDWLKSSKEDFLSSQRDWELFIDTFVQIQFEFNKLKLNLENLIDEIDGGVVYSEYKRGRL